MSFKHSGGSCVGVWERDLWKYNFNRNLYFSCIPDVDVNIVESMKIILLQCAADQLDQELYVMHVASCGPTRLVILLTSMVLMKCLVQLLYFIWSTTTQVFSSSWSWMHKSNDIFVLFPKKQQPVFRICHLDLK